MKKKIIFTIFILLAIVLLCPIPMRMNDGGTVHYNAILYDVYDVHRIKPVDMPNADGTYETKYIDGIIVEVFGVELFNNTEPHTASH